MNAHFSPLAMFTVLLLLGAVATFGLMTSRVNSFFFFGRTAPEKFRGTPAGRRITQRYMARVLISFGLAVMLLTAMYQHYGRSLFASFMAALLLQVVFQNVAFSVAHSAAGRALAKSEPGYADESHAVTIALQPAVRPLSLVAMLAPAVTAACLWGAATLLGHDGIAAFTERAGAAEGSGLLGMAAGIVCSATALLLLIRYSSRHRTRMAHYMVRAMLVLDWYGALLAGAVALAALAHHAITRKDSVFALGVVVGLVVVHFLYGWSRQRQFTPPPAEQYGDRHWKLGMYYCNRQDPALFVQKRCGPGYTLNFGNRYAWPIALLVLGDLVFLTVHHMRG